MPESKIIKCPLCKEGDIIISFRERRFTTKIVRAGSNRKTIPQEIPERIDVIIEKCPICGKGKKEIERALKHGKEPSREDVIARLKALGIDPSKVK